MQATADYAICEMSPWLASLPLNGKTRRTPRGLARRTLVVAPSLTARVQSGLYRDIYESIRCTTDVLCTRYSAAGRPRSSRRVRAQQQSAWKEIKERGRYKGRQEKQLGSGSVFLACWSAFESNYGQETRGDTHTAFLNRVTLQPRGVLGGKPVSKRKQSPSCAPLAAAPWFALSGELYNRNHYPAQVVWTSFSSCK